MHRKLSQQAIGVLKGFDEVSKIILYGSVLSGNYRPDSDIDLAVICDDVWRGLPLDFEGIPFGLRSRINERLGVIENRTGIVFHISIYWDSEFKDGIELYSGKKYPPDFLHEVGSVVYDAYKD